jgi:hypothetical protein
VITKSRRLLSMDTHSHGWLSHGLRVTAGLFFGGTPALGGLLAACNHHPLAAATQVPPQSIGGCIPPKGRTTGVSARATRSVRAFAAAFPFSSGSAPPEILRLVPSKFDAEGHKQPAGATTIPRGSVRGGVPDKGGVPCTRPCNGATRDTRIFPLGLEHSRPGTSRRSRLRGLCQSATRGEAPLFSRGLYES